MGEEWSIGDRYMSHAGYRPEPEFGCGGCGTGMPTLQETRFSNGMCGAGDSEYKVTVYDKRQDSYFVSLTDPLPLAGYFDRVFAERKATAAKKIEQEVHEAVSKEDMANIVINVKSISAISKLASERESIDEKIKELSKSADRHDPFYIHTIGFPAKGNPISLDYKCGIKLLSSRPREEVKYVRDNGKKKVLRAVVNVKASRIHNYFDHFLGDFPVPKLDEMLSFDVRHFSEFGGD